MFSVISTNLSLLRKGSLLEIVGKTQRFRYQESDDEIIETVCCPLVQEGHLLFSRFCY